MMYMSKNETSTSEQAGDSNCNDHDRQKINGSFENSILLISVYISREDERVCSPKTSHCGLLFQYFSFKSV